MKLIDVYDKIADGTIDDYFEFNFKNHDWIWDGENIRTKEKSYDCGDYASYKFIDEVIEFSDLSEDINIIELDTDESLSYTTSEDYTSVSSYVRDGYVSVLPEIKKVDFNSLGYDKKPYTCPVCFGRGHVSNGFYSTTGNTWVTSTTMPEPCRSCGGTGVIWHD